MRKIYLSGLLALLLIILVIFIKTNAIYGMDLSIGKQLYSLNGHAGLSFITWIGMLGSTVGIITVLFMSMILFAIVSKNFIASAILFLSVLIGNLGNKLLKAVIERERPTFPAHLEDGFSFPSGHVMVGLLLYGMVAYYLIKASHTKKMEQIIVSSTSLLLIIIGFSRLIEGEHFITDVVGGFISGALFLVGMITLDKFIHTKLDRKKVKSDVAL